MAVVGGENAMDTLNGWFKELYADKEIRAVPEAAWIVKNIPFNKSESGLGNLYHQPVVLTQEHGFTYAAPASGAFALNAAIAAVMKDAQIQGAQMLLRSQIDYETLARAANTKASFGEASRLLVDNMMSAMSKRLEIMFLYGRSPGGVAVLNGTHTGSSFTVSAASWAPGLWAGMEGAKIHVTSVTGTYPALSIGTKRAGSGTAVVSVAFDTRIVTVTTSSLTSAANSDVVFLYGTVSCATDGLALTNGETITFLEALGLDGMCSSAGQTVFNINTATYGLFAPNKPSTLNAALTVTNVLQSILPAIGKGLMDDVVLLCSNKAFQDMVNPTVDPTANGGTDNKVKTGVMLTKGQSDSVRLGAKSIDIVGHQGLISITPHLFLKDSDVFVFAKKHLMRVGATDITFNTPGSKGGEFFLHLPSNAGYELRAYCNQALFSPELGKVTKITIS